MKYDKASIAQWIIENDLKQLTTNLTSTEAAYLFLEVNQECFLSTNTIKQYIKIARKGDYTPPVINNISEIAKQMKANQGEASKVFKLESEPYDVKVEHPNLIQRPQIKETQTNYHQLKQMWDKKLYKVLIFSDSHGWLGDLKALRCINKVLQHNRYDEVCINGDIVDLPYLSRHPKKLYEDGILNGYSEVKEMIYTKEQILDPLRLSTDANIRVRLGNHDSRITEPNILTESQLGRLAILHKYFNTTQFDTMLGLKESDGYIYDPSTVFTYFDMFDVVHGLSLAKNAPEKNIQEYMSSGTSGHTHRLNSKFLTNRKSPYVWFESGCTRICEEVEYLPTGKIADWQQGFIDISFLVEGDKVRFFAHAVNILEGRCLFNGVVYDGN